MQSAFRTYEAAWRDQCQEISRMIQHIGLKIQARRKFFPLSIATLSGKKHGQLCYELLLCVVQ